MLEAAPPLAATGVEAAPLTLRRELLAWSALAVTALGIAGSFALLLAFSRVPGSERLFAWPADFFHKGLVIHVVFSFIVWFQSVFGALAAVASASLGTAAAPGGRGSWLGLTAVAATAVAMPLLFFPAFLDRGEATLNNYVPVIIDPLYYAGLGLLACALGMAALRLLLNARGPALAGRPLAASLACAAAAALVALVCFVLAWSQLVGTTPSYWFNENLVWGGGHVLQFVNTILVIVAWAMLLQRASGGTVSMPVAVPAAVPVACLVLTLATLAAPAFYALLPVFSGPQARAFTWLQYLLGPLAALAAFSLLRRRTAAFDRRHPAGLALLLSLLLFAVGGVLGLFVDGADTRTPAHYHGVIAAVTLAFMGLFYALLLPLLARPLPSRRTMLVSLHLFAWGQLAACLGLFLAGGHGAPRKVAGAAQGLGDIAAYVGLGLNGLGGLVAVIGGIVFVVAVGRALIRAPESAAPALTIRL